jgi:hypothetical protein
MPPCWGFEALPTRARGARPMTYPLLGSSGAVGRGAPAQSTGGLGHRLVVVVARPGHSPCGSSEGVRRGRRLGRRDAGLRPRMPPDQGVLTTEPMRGNADSPPIPTANLLRYLKRSRASLQQSKDCSTGRPCVTLRHRHTNYASRQKARPNGIDVHEP